MSKEIEPHFENDIFEPNRKQITINIDSLVQHCSKIYKITQVLDFESVIGRDVETGRCKQLRIHELHSVPNIDEGQQLQNTDLAEIADTDWLIAEKRFAAIKPLLDEISVGRADIEVRATEVGVASATLYRWLKRYKACGVVAALIPFKRGWSTGKSRITSESDSMIEAVINEFYLTPQRPTVQKTIIEIQRRCHEYKIKPPSVLTIRARIAKVSEKESLHRRGYKEKAKNKFYPVPGSFPNANFPLAVVQIDHTKADIIVVDDIYRKPIGRPWITLAMDVYSRMITGYYLSFDHPSETSVGMCVTHTILPKEDWLLLHKVDAEWPVWGIPRTIHVDNGADFRSDTFRQSCSAYGINLEFRPVKVPRYGGHIERVFGTLLNEIHTLPGTTFSSVKQREGYDSDKESSMTKSEFEEWLVTFICKVYHEKIHSSIGMSPRKKWDLGIFGNNEEPGIGLPPIPPDRHTILLDFLPMFKRTIQPFGVCIDDLTYYDESLRLWINAKDESTDKKRLFIFRRDPRDISVVWFYDPNIKQYFKIPFANQSFPSMSIWEYKQIREKLKNEGLKSVNEQQILRGLTELREIVDKSKEKTKTARRKAQNRVEHEKKITPAMPMPLKNDKASHIVRASNLLDGDVEDFGDIS